MRQLKEQKGRLPKELGKAVGENNWVVASFKGLPNTLIPFESSIIMIVPNGDFYVTKLPV